MNSSLVSQATVLVKAVIKQRKKIVNLSKESGKEPSEAKTIAKTQRCYNLMGVEGSRNPKTGDLRTKAVQLVDGGSDTSPQNVVIHV
jgi:hypothetical protein